MDKNAFWKWLILIALVAGSLVLVTPPKEKIVLGLDLKGGTSFVVAIDKEQVERDIRDRQKSLTDEEVQEKVDNILTGSQERALEVLRNRINNLGVAEPIIFPDKNNRIIIQLPGIDDKIREEAEALIKSVAFLEFRMVHEDNDVFVEDLFDKDLAPEGYRISTEQPGNFYKRDDSFPSSSMGKEYRKKLSNFNVPEPGYEFMLEKDEVQYQGQSRTIYRPHYVKIRREMSGEYLKSAKVDYRNLGDRVVALAFDKKGAKKFSAITSDYRPGGAKNPDPNNYRQMAIVLDGTLYSAPRLTVAIHGGRAEITGRFTQQQAGTLCNVLKSGSLPAPVKIVEKRFVAPSLGADSIKSGMNAIIYGGIGVVIFMLLYYMLAGVVANMALVLNMILLPLGMITVAGFMGIFIKNVGGGGIKLPVLTLPGIAGILLTIGMAVDANVLIFERMREEFRSGKRLWAAITAGYDRAFITIIDANLTTLLTGVILFIFGSGPIRGFAVTLCAGIVVSMYTALVVTKLLFGAFAKKSNAKKLHMLTIVKANTNINFVGMRKMAIIVSLLVIASSWFFMVGKGMKAPGKVFGIDFTGGASVTLTFSEKQSVESIRDTLTTAGVKDPHIQYQKEIETGGDEYLIIRTGAQPVDGVKPVDLVRESLLNGHPEAGFVFEQEDEVGPQVGSELKKRAVLAIVWALVGIIIYISWRFELGFAVGAIAALAHDVLITVGIYCLFGRQLSLPVVAALLTIVGYSVNDTIVVFDRIREDLKLVRNKTFKEICNLSINQTLSRTLLTSITTLIVVAMLLVFGGGAINDFALALCIGVLAGTYSSVFVATPVVLSWYRNKKPDFAVK